MKQVIFFVSSLALTSLFLSSCGNGDSSTATRVNEANEDIDLSEFYAFYRQFHNDSLFQMAHVMFPLKGLPRDADSSLIAADNFVWTREDWIMHRPFDFELSEFEREIKPYRSNMIEERIIHSTTGAGMVRRFARLGDDEWYLIYYADMNRIRRTGQ